MSNINRDNEDGEGTLSQAITRGIKRKVASKPLSTVWNEFQVCDGELYEDKMQRAKCKHCTNEYKADSKTRTSNLLCHLMSCKKYLSTVSACAGNGSSVRIDPLPSKLDDETCEEYMCKITIRHDLPYTFVEFEEVHRFLKYLNPFVRHWSRNSHMSNIFKLNAKLRVSVKHALENLPGRIALSTDIWTSMIGESYICVTAHYISSDWNLRSKVLTFQDFEPPHKGIEIYEKVFELLKDWGIESKIFSITLDNASNINNMQSLLCGRLNLQNALVSRGKYFHVRCSADIFNLIVQDGVKVVTKHLKGIRDSVLYVRGSEAKKMKFLECAAVVGVDISKSLWLDVPARWNSTYLMLERALFYRPVFCQLNIVDSCYEHCPAVDEWDKLAKIVKLLEPLYNMTTLFSDSGYPTANLYFENVWRMQMLIKEATDDPDMQIKEVAQQMGEKFEKYWEDFSMVLTFAIVLDPRYKLVFVKYCYEKMVIAFASKYLDVRDQLYSLFREYEACGASSHLHDRREIHSYLLDFDKYRSTSLDEKSELDLYLMERRHSIQLKLDVLTFWKANEVRYPILARMARDILSIPITSVASESTFSMSGKILNKYRNRILPENIQALVTSYSWLYGYEVGEHELLHLNGLEVPLKSVTNSEVSSNSNSI